MYTNCSQKGSGVLILEVCNKWHMSGLTKSQGKSPALNIEAIGETH